MSVNICMWSGPRNLSTAMMRSFGSRADTSVWDEPFYAPYLAATGKVHPGSAETLEAHEQDPKPVADKAGGNDPDGKACWFQKHMPQHMLPQFAGGWMENCRHFMLLRDPRLVIASFAKGRPDFDIEEVGFRAQAALWKTLSAAGHTVPVISSEDILKNPAAMLRKLCAALDIQFDPAMLSWSAGARPEDGAWAPYWYKSVEQSTGFTPYVAKDPGVPARYAAMAETCRPAYLEMMEKRIRPETH